MPDKKTVLVYQTKDGQAPFNGWIDKIKDILAKARIRTQINRLRLGLLGDAKSVGNGVHELRIDTGKGYRVYFANHGQNIVILLYGGNKKTQDKDIRLSKEYWNDYKTREKSKSAESINCL